MVQEVAQTYEQPDAVVRWHYESRERLNDFEALAVEHNVVEWVLAQGAGHGRADHVRGADGASASVEAAAALSRVARRARRRADPSSAGACLGRSVAVSHKPAGYPA